MKRIIIIAVLAYLVYYLYNKKNTGASATTKESGPDPYLIGKTPVNTVSVTKDWMSTLGLSNAKKVSKILINVKSIGGYNVGQSVKLFNSKLYPGIYTITKVHEQRESLLPSDSLPKWIILDTPYIADENDLVIVNVPSQAEPSLVDPVGTSNANIAALQAPVKSFLSNLSINGPWIIDTSDPAMHSRPLIIEERIPSSTGDTPYWMPNGEEMIYPRGLEFSIAAQYGNF
jgi:hypothetical protein